MLYAKLKTKNELCFQLIVATILFFSRLTCSKSMFPTKLCNSGETIYLTYQDPIVTLPCITNYSKDSLKKDRLQLYKGYNTDWELINTTDPRLISYKPEIGFVYNISQDSYQSRIYKCTFLSNVKDYIILNLTQSVADVMSITDNDNIGNCHYEYTLEDEGNFTCSAAKSEFKREFRWFYKTNDWQTIPVPGSYKSGPDVRDVITSTMILPFRDYPNITRIICKVQEQNSTKWSQTHLKIRIRGGVPAKPEILDLSLEPNRKLICKYKVYPPDHSVLWHQDGKPLNGSEPEIIHTSNNLVSSSINIPPTDESENEYTCIVSNFLGSTSKSKIIKKPMTNLVYAFIVYITLPIVLSIVLGSSVVAATIIYKNRQNKNRYRPLLLYGDASSVYSYESTASPSSELSWEMLGPLQPLDSTGEHGIFYTARVLADGRQIVFKTFKYPRTNNEVTASLAFWIFLKEIKIMQYLGPHPYIVKFEGIILKALFEFKVFLGLEYCPDQLEILLKKCRTESFQNDIVQGHYIYGNRNCQHTPLPEVLRTSHLMKWAEQIAAALEYLVFKGLVHRDIAARNILLTWVSEGCETSVDNLKVQLADFGHARDIREMQGQRYIVALSNGWQYRELKLPVTRYPIEALENRGYTHKSDVYSFGCLLWEMFTLAMEEPYSNSVSTDLDFARYTSALADHLRVGNRLKRPDIVPPQIWDIMEMCWKNDPNDRPTFACIHEKLRAINISYGIHSERIDVSDLCQPQNDPPDENRNGNNQIRTESQLPAGYSQLLLQM